MATLDFKGKALVQNYHLSVKYHELVPKRDRSLTDKVRLDDNLIIHGDNLKALKALLPTYAGQVKCIYIDPPYNTGSEGWAYNDNVNSPMMQEWLGKVVDSDDLKRVKAYLEALKNWRVKNDKVIAAIGKDAALDVPLKAWEEIGGKNYRSRKNGIGESLPNFCLKIPTGGGKTLLAAHTVDLVNRSYRQKQTGLVLWVTATCWWTSRAWN